MFYTYVIFNKVRNKIYVGQSDNLEKRLKRHNGELINKKGSYTTINSGKWIVIYQEEYNSRHEAMIREKQLKTQKGRAFIWNIVKNLVIVAQR